jgi:LmbE family N-acetylglucosaminyl deacetylase
MDGSGSRLFRPVGTYTIVAMVSRFRSLPVLSEDWERAVCVVAHPDDLEYGAASAVSRWTDLGKQVSYLLATSGEAGIDALPPEKTGPLGGGITNQADHRAVGLAVLDAARDAGNRWVFPELLGEGLEPWNGVRFAGFSNSARITHGVDVTEHLDRGIASLRTHAAYMDGLGEAAFDPAEMLTGAAEFHGSRLGVRFGVAFEVYEIKPGTATAVQP